jgi:aminomethyltransferase
VQLKRTALFGAHQALGAKLVDFAGWDMPIHYGSQLDEHHAVRQAAGMFDVSHMLAVDLRGPRTREFLRYLLANDVAKLQAPGKALYTCMLDELGGILDDLIVYFLEEQWFRVVVNAGTAQKDIDWIGMHGLTFGVSVTPRTDLGILAVQGPQARVRVLQRLGSAEAAAADALRPFFACVSGERLIARTGYTGEDGLELMLPNTEITAFWQQLLDAGVRPCGLGARDTLRLEAGMNLYGQDMDETVGPLECGLGWTVAWEPPERAFIGRGPLQTLREAAPRKQIALVLEGRGVLRAHQPVRGRDGNGETTSGSFAPTLKGSIAFARVSAAAGPPFEVEIRGQWLPARQVKAPFVRNGKVLI